MEANFHEGVEQQAPFNVFAGRWAVQGHGIWLSESCKEVVHPGAAAVPVCAFARRLRFVLSVGA
jgi:hypothetical protein